MNEEMLTAASSAAQPFPYFQETIKQPEVEPIAAFCFIKSYIIFTLESWSYKSCETEWELIKESAKHKILHCCKSENSKIDPTLHNIL